MDNSQQRYEALLAKYLRNECTDQEKALLVSWYDALDGKLPVPQADELQALAQKNWSGVASRMTQQQPAVRPLPIWTNGRKMAAVFGGFLLLVGLGWYVGGKDTRRPTASANQSTNSPGWIVQSNHTAQGLRIILPDASTVLLQPGSELLYSPQFSQANRSVQLRGNAFFDVKRDPAHPFRVQTKWLAVTVLGTSFAVNSLASGAEVAVRTGRVEVIRRQDQAKLVLTPNERVRVSPEARPLVKSLVERPVVVHPEVVVNRPFNFANTSVAQVFRTLEQAYNITIQFDAGALANCTLTAQLTDQPLFTKVDMICSSIGASYVVEGTRIVIRSSGCAPAD